MARGGLLLRKIRAQVSSIPTGFSWFVDGMVAASGFPASRRQIKWVHAQGIAAVVTLTEYPLPKDLTESIDMEFVHIPMNDHLPPAPEKLLLAAKEVEDRVRQNKAVLVHCLAGLGRTGTVLAAWLILNGISASEAIERVRKARPGSIERSQEYSLHSLQSMLEKLKG